MTKLMPVKPQSFKAWLDEYKLELLTFLKIPLAVYMFLVATSFLLSGISSMKLSGNLLALLTGFCSVAVAGTVTLLAIKLIITTTLQLKVMLSLRTMQFEQAHKKCLDVLRFFQRVPLVHGDELAFFEVSVGMARMGLGDYAGAEVMYLSAVEHYKGQRQRASLSNAAYYNPGLLVVFCLLSDAFAQQDKIEEGTEAANNALECFRALGGDFFARMEVGPIFALGSLHLRSYALTEAESEFYQVFKICECTKPIPTVSSTSDLPALAASCLGLAILCVHHGRVDEGNEHWQNFLTRQKQSRMPLAPSFLSPLNVLARKYMEVSDLAQAKNVLAWAYGLATSNSNHPESKQTLDLYEQFLRATGHENDIEKMRTWSLVTEAD